MSNTLMQPMTGTYLAYIITTDQQKAQILAVGVAFLFAIITNLVFVGLIEIFGAWSNEKPEFNYRFRDNVTRHIFLFGIGCLFSCCSLLGMYGIFQAILAWLSLLVLIALHILHVMSGDNLQKFRSIFTVVYYGLITVWYFGIMVSFFHLSPK